MIPNNYAWLEKVNPPLIIKEALKLHGVVETPGEGNNSKILAWADEIGKEAPSAYNKWVANWYDKDSIAWCGLFAAIVALRAKKAIPKNYLAAKSWLEFGNAVDVPGLGDVLVFSRKGGGHVGFYIAEDETCYHVLGGNQSDKVCISRILKSRCIGIRRPEWKIAQPASVQQRFVHAQGMISTNEQ